MPITPDEAISAIFTGVSQVVEKDGVDPDLFHGFLNQVEEEAHETRVALAWFDVALEEGDPPEDLQKMAEHVYCRTAQVAAAALMLLAHFPHLSKIEHASPGQKPADG